MPTGERVSLVDRVLEIARGEVGHAEATRHNDGVPSTRYMGGRREPWCGHFVAFLFRTAGCPLPGDVVPTETRPNPIASVTELARVLEAHGLLVRAPMRGDLLLLLERGRSDQGPGHHVAIVERAGLTMLNLISGNWGDQVARHTMLREKLTPETVMAIARIPEPAGWHYP